MEKGKPNKIRHEIPTAHPQNFAKLPQHTSLPREIVDPRNLVKDPQQSSQPRGTTETADPQNVDKTPQHSSLPRGIVDTVQKLGGKTPVPSRHVASTSTEPLYRLNQNTWKSNLSALSSVREKVREVESSRRKARKGGVDEVEVSHSKSPEVNYSRSSEIIAARSPEVILPRSPDIIHSRSPAGPRHQAREEPRQVNQEEIRNPVKRTLSYPIYTESMAHRRHDSTGYENIMEPPRDRDQYHPGGESFSPDGYANKRSVSLGMIDIALLVANASQLKFMLKEGSPVSDNFYKINISCICISVVLQIILGILLIWNSRYSVRIPNQRKRAERINNAVTINVFLITVINVLGGSFGELKLSNNITSTR